jgi:hypothetical protein
MFSRKMIVCQQKNQNNESYIAYYGDVFVRIKQLAQHSVRIERNAAIFCIYRSVFMALADEFYGRAALRIGVSDEVTGIVGPKS